nr:hypothetical protein [Tanacetum cinerariifolium]
EDDAEVQEAVEIVTIAKLMTEVVTTATTQVVSASTATPAAKPAVVAYTRRYHRYKKKPQSESKVRKNMIAYLKNTEGFKMEF